MTAKRWNGSLRIGVDDQGSGVAYKDRDAVWRKFWRHQRHRREAIAGTGIGLSVVRELITLHGGTAWVEDAPGGTNDYVTKPFGVLELLARIEALLRRAQGPSADEGEKPEQFGDIVVEPSTRRVLRAGNVVPLTPKEFDLLIALVRRRGAVASRIELMTDVWGYNDSVLSRTVDTHVAELRRKLEENAAEPRYLMTVRKVGYRWDPGARD